MIDKSLVAERFAKAYRTYDSESSVQKYAADVLMDNVVEELSSSGALDRVMKIYEIGCGTGLLSRRIVSRLRVGELWMNDLCAEAADWVGDLVEGGAHFVCGDAETALFPAGLDLVVSASTIQWIGDLQGFFSRCAGALRGGGMLAVSGFGPRNLLEIKELTGAGLDCPSLEEMVAALPEGMVPVVSRAEVVELVYDCPLAVLRHLKRSGVTGIRREAWTREDLAGFEAGYRERFSCERGVRLTYEVLWVLGVKAG